MLASIDDPPGDVLPPVPDDLGIFTMLRGIPTLRELAAQQPTQALGSGFVIGVLTERETQALQRVRPAGDALLAPLRTERQRVAPGGAEIAHRNARLPGAGGDHGRSRRRGLVAPGIGVEQVVAFLAVFREGAAMREDLEGTV